MIGLFQKYNLKFLLSDCRDPALLISIYFIILPSTMWRINLSFFPPSLIRALSIFISEVFPDLFLSPLNYPRCLSFASASLHFEESVSFSPSLTRPTRVQFQDFEFPSVSPVVVVHLPIPSQL